MSENTTNNKYFTPSIEDIRVGYKCEIFNKVVGEYWDGETFIEPEWQPLEMNKYALGQDWSNRIFHQTIRVPYLTKEQIEAEGWKSFDLSKGFAYRAGVPSYRFGFTKDNYFVVLDTRKYHIEIGALDVLKIDFLPEFPETFRVTIPCKDINTFRYINKLLGI